MDERQAGDEHDKIEYWLNTDGGRKRISHRWREGYNKEITFRIKQIIGTDYRRSHDSSYTGWLNKRVISPVVSVSFNRKTSEFPTANTFILYTCGYALEIIHCRFQSQIRENNVSITGEYRKRWQPG